MNIRTSNKRKKVTGLLVLTLIATLLVPSISLAVTGTTQRVSIDSNGVEANGHSFSPDITPDGQCVTFASDATNLVAGDTNGLTDIFVHERNTGITERVSVSSGGGQLQVFGAHWPKLTDDCRYVFFYTEDANMVAGDTNGSRDVFRHDRVTGITERVSLGNSGNQGNGQSLFHSISADGTCVAWAANAGNLVTNDTNGIYDIFVRDLNASTTVRVSVDSAGSQANGTSEGPTDISADCTVVAFQSSAGNLVTSDTNATADVFVHMLASGVTELVSVDSNGIQGNGASIHPILSDDGTIIALSSQATNLVPVDTNNTWDVYVHDRQSGLTERVTVDSNGMQVNGPSSNNFPADMSGDGRFVAYESLAPDLVFGDTNGLFDVFVHDRQTGQTERVSIDGSGVEANNSSYDSPAIDASGLIVAYSSSATNLIPVDTNSVDDIFIAERDPILPTPTASPLPTSTPTPTVTPVPPLFSLNDFVLFALESLQIKRGSAVVGDVGANDVSSGPYVAGDDECTIGQNVQLSSSNSSTVCDSIKIKLGAEVYNIYYNELENNGTLLGMQTTPLSLPVIGSLPSLPTFSPGIVDLTIAQGDSLTILAGDYALLKARKNATLIFAGGLYQFDEVDIGQNVKMYFLAQSEIRVASKWAVDKNSFVGPDPSATSLEATDIVIYINGLNGSNGNLGATPKAAKFGEAVTVIANVYVPNGTLWLRQKTLATGAFLAKWIVVGENVSLSLESGW